MDKSTDGGSFAPCEKESTTVASGRRPNLTALLNHGGGVFVAEVHSFRLPRGFMLIPMSLARPEGAGWFYAAGMHRNTRCWAAVRGYCDPGALLLRFRFGQWADRIFRSFGGKVQAFRAPADWGALEFIIGKGLTRSLQAS